MINNCNIRLKIILLYKNYDALATNTFPEFNYSIKQMRPTNAIIIFLYSFEWSEFHLVNVFYSVFNKF